MYDRPRVEMTSLDHYQSWLLIKTMELLLYNPENLAQVCQ